MKKNELSLPTTRFQLFKDVYKNRLNLIFKIGLLSFLFSLPIIAILILTNIKIYEINLEFQNGYITHIESLQQTLNFLDARNLCFLITIPLISILFSGIFNVIRKLLYQDGILFWDDFKKGIKNNYKAFALSFFIFSLSYFLLIHTFYSSMILDNEQSNIALLFSALFFFLVVTTLPLILNQSIIYNLSYPKMFINAFLIAFRKFYIYIPLLLFNVGTFALLLIKGQFTFIFFVIIIPIILIPLLIIINMIFSDYVFDLFINKANFPEIYRKGLYENAENSNTELK